MALRRLVPNYIQGWCSFFPQIAITIGVLTSTRLGGRGATNHFGGLDVVAGCHCSVLDG